MRLLTVREACEQLRISRATLYNLARKGKLGFVKIEGKSLIRDDVIQRLIAQGSQGRSLRPPGSRGAVWASLWDDLVRRGLVEPASREAFLAPRLVPFSPVGVKGKRPSETIIEERGSDSCLLTSSSSSRQMPFFLAWPATRGSPPRTLWITPRAPSGPLPLLPEADTGRFSKLTKATTSFISGPSDLPES